MKIRTLGALGALALSGVALQFARTSAIADEPATAAKPAGPATTKPMSIYDFKLPSLEGKTVDLSQYKGKVVLVVNTASKCGYTKQYAGLQALNEKYGKEGLVVLGFPANNFGGQEPGSDAEIGEFCQKNYGVTFPMFSKVSVKGADKAPLFQYLTADANPDFKGEIGWNFEKFLISRDGKLVERFKSPVAPDSKELTAAVDAQLAKK
jgi:glutathione peroxidase